MDEPNTPEWSFVCFDEVVFASFSAEIPRENFKPKSACNLLSAYATVDHQSHPRRPF